MQITPTPLWVCTFVSHFAMRATLSLTCAETCSYDMSMSKLAFSLLAAQLIGSSYGCHSP